MCLKDGMENFFNWSVNKYSRINVQKLLDAELECAGTLLEVILNGIDNLGGLYYGFDKGSSKRRSIQFMKEIMKIDESLAKFLYEIVRCGIVHQGTPKIGVKYFLEYKYSEKGKIFYKSSDGHIWLNVVGLARLYLDTIEIINSNPEQYIHDYPKLQNGDKNIFNDAINKIENDIDVFAYDIGNKRMQEKYPQASLSAYKANGTLNISIDSPNQRRTYE